MYISISGFFLIMECISSQQYLSYSPAWRWAGSGEHPHPKRASRRGVASLDDGTRIVIRRVARSQHNSYTHREN